MSHSTLISFAQFRGSILATNIHQRQSLPGNSSEVTVEKVDDEERAQSAQALSVFAFPAFCFTAKSQNGLLQLNRVRSCGELSYSKLGLEIGSSNVPRPIVGTHHQRKVSCGHRLVRTQRQFT